MSNRDIQKLTKLIKVVEVEIPKCLNDSTDTITKSDYLDLSSDTYETFSNHFNPKKVEIQILISKLVSELDYLKFLEISKTAASLTDKLTDFLNSINYYNNYFLNETIKENLSYTKTHSKRITKDQKTFSHLIIILKKIYNISLNFQRKKVMKQKRKSFKELFKPFSSQNFTFKYKIAGKKIIIKIIMKQDDNLKKIILKTYQKILTELSSNPKYKAEVAWANEGIKNYNQLIHGLVWILADYLMYPLKHNQSLVRSDKVSYYVNFSSNYSAAYYGNISSFSKVFFTINIEEPIFIETLIKSYLLDRIFFNSELYKTFVHELTHAYDWTLNTKKDTYQLAKTLIGKEPSYFTSYLADYIENIRREGLARFSETVSVPWSQDQNKSIFYLKYLFYSKGDNLQKLETAVIETIKKGIKKPNEFNSLVSNSYEINSSKYVMGFFILLMGAVLKCPVEIYHTINPKMITNIENVPKSLKKRYQTNIKEIYDKRLYNKKHLYLIVQNNSVNILKREIQRVSLMNLHQFWKYYLKNCELHGIKPFITSDDFIELENEADHQFKLLFESLSK